MTRLGSGDPFPHLSVDLVDGTAIDLPTALAGGYGVVLLYRASWCPFCNAQLGAFERMREELAGIDTKIVALSTDDAETTRATVERLSLGFPVGHSADADAIAAITGAFVNPGPRFLQSTGFVLDPSGRVVLGVYSSGAIGRLVPEDVAGLVRHLRSRPRTS